MSEENQGALESALAELDARWPEATRPAQAWLDRGRILQRLQRNTSALAAFNRALELDPDADAPALAKAALLEELENPEAALAVYDDLVHRHPDLVAGWSNRAGLLLQMGSLEAAHASLDRALGLDPDNLLLLFNHGLLLWQGLDRPQEALEFLDRAAAAGIPEAVEAAAACRASLLPPQA